jgi:hypothetical protein
LYLPVNSIKRDGEHDAEASQCVKLIPCLAIESKFGVEKECPPFTVSAEYPMSSHRIKIMFGFWFWAVTGVDNVFKQNKRTGSISFMNFLNYFFLRVKYFATELLANLYNLS